MTELRSAEEWIKILNIKCEVLDPDGWDRTNFGKSWDEAISKKVFFERMDRSTCAHVARGMEPYCSCLMERPEEVSRLERHGRS